MWSIYCTYTVLHENMSHRPGQCRRHWWGRPGRCRPAPWGWRVSSCSVGSSAPSAASPFSTFIITKTIIKAIIKVTKITSYPFLFQGNKSKSAHWIYLFYVHIDIVTLATILETLQGFFVFGFLIKTIPSDPRLATWNIFGSRFQFAKISQFSENSH